MRQLVSDDINKWQQEYSKQNNLNVHLLEGSIAPKGTIGKTKETGHNLVV